MFGKSIYERQIKSLTEIRDKMVDSKDVDLIDNEIKILVSKLNELVRTKFVESITIKEIDPCGIFLDKSWEIDLPKEIKILIPNDSMYEPMKKSRYIMRIGDVSIMINRGDSIQVLDNSFG